MYHKDIPEEQQPQGFYTALRNEYGSLDKASTYEKYADAIFKNTMDHPLRIDANQGWDTADNAIRVLQALGPFNIEHCEEPIARHRFMELSRVSAASPIPIMADESCGDEHDAERLIALRACAQFNIKLGKSSGFYKGIQIAQLGAAAGMHMQVGGFMR